MHPSAWNTNSTPFVNKGKRRKSRGLCVGPGLCPPRSCNRADGGYGPRGGGASPASKATIGGELMNCCVCALSSSIGPLRIFTHSQSAATTSFGSASTGSKPSPHTIVSL